MSALGLRYCQNHPAWPLILVSNGRGTYWRCEHESGCAYTEGAMRVGPRRGVVGINGRAVTQAGKGKARNFATTRQSPVEDVVIAEENARRDRP